ncbi:MAG: hypothetical protein GEV11_17895 [Streptosporangiales bacterium]|nr:hypothetical protein [Streptosporangiales bacterium]
MRPARFLEFLHAAVASAATEEHAVTGVTSFADEGITDTPAGIVMTFATGARIYWQAVFTSPEQQGAWADPEQIAEGDPAPAPETPRPALPNDGPIPITVAEAWLTHVLLSQGSREIALAYPRSRPPEPSIYTHTSYGTHARFHSGGTVTILPMYTLRPGTDPHGSQRHKVLERI